MNEQSLFAEVLDIPDPTERAAFLDRACGGDADLRRRLDRLLERHRDAGSFLGRPPLAADETAAFAPDAGGADDVGNLIGPYRLLEVIGQGGMGVVYMAEQSEPVKRRVALKVIKPGMDSQAVVARFEAERQALALMDHPNIARVFDGGTTGSTVTSGLGRPYFVMELVRGLPITDYCDQVRLSVPERLALFVQVCRAVQHAHQKGVIHRDLKPSNVLVTEIDGRPVPKVIDFGIAKATGVALADRPAHTGFHQAVGTPLYMAPEQTGLSGVDVDTRADVYSLGVLLYELLTGTTPFDGEALRQAGFDEMRRILREDEPDRPSRRVSTLAVAKSSTISERRKLDPRRLGRLMRSELDWVVMTALEKDRNRRYESASAFAADVERYLADRPVLAAPPSAAYRLRKFARRNRAAVLGGVVFALLVALGVAGTSIGLVRALWAEDAASRAAASEAAQRQEAEGQRDRAVREKRRADDEAATARAVSEFQRQLLSEASPDRNARNQKVTVEEVLQRAAARIPTELAGQPRVEAAIRLTIGESLLQLGKAEAAMPHLERAAELRRRELGPDHADTLEAELSVALGHQYRGQFERAEQLGAAALAACRRVLGDDHPHTLTGMNNLALTYEGLGRNDEAEKLYVEGLEGRRRVNGETHGETLTVATNLAQFYVSRKRTPEAEPLFRFVLEVSRKEGRPETLVTLHAMNGLGNLYDERKDRGKSESMYRDALAVCRRVVGDDHPTTAIALSNLGATLNERSEFAKAEPLLVEALTIARRVFEPGHPDTAPVMESLAITYRSVEKNAQAAALLVELIDLKGRKRVGPPPGGTSVEFLKERLDECLDDMADEAMVHSLTAGRFDLAIPLYEDVLRIRRAMNGPDHSATLTALDKLASAHTTAAQPEKAIPLVEELLKRQAGSLGRKHPTVIAKVAQLGKCYQDVGRLADALPLLREAHDGSPVGSLQRRQLAPLVLNGYVKAGRVAEAIAFGKAWAAGVRADDNTEAITVSGQLNIAGKALIAAGAFTGAEALLRDALALRDRIGPLGLLRHEAAGLLGEAVAGQGRNADAEMLLLASYDGFLNTKSPLSSGYMRGAVERLVHFYNATNRPEKAREWTARMPREVAPRPRPVQ